MRGPGGLTERMLRRRLGGTAAVGLSLAFAGAVVRPLHAQDPSQVRIGIRYEPGYVPGLVMPAVKPGVGLEEIAARADSILRADFDYSDRFEIIPVPDSLGVGSTVNYGLWNQLGAVWLVTADVSGRPDEPLLRLGLHDVVYGELKNVQAFALPPPGSDGFRMAVHRASDAVVEWAVGEPGIAATRIAFRRKRSDGGSALIVMDSDGREARSVARTRGWFYTPAFSSDGGRLLYQLLDEGGGTAVYELDLRTGARRVVSKRPGLNITPTYTPGGHIALARSVGDQTEIFELGRGQLTHTIGGVALNPSYSPDGRRLAFEATPLGQQQIYVQELAGGGRPALISRYVQGERGSAAGPDWSPRGDRIAYSGWVDGAFQIFTVNPDGTERRILTSRGINEDPSWAPDGRHLVFSSEQRTGRGLWILDTVTGRTRILVSGHDDAVPDWSDRLPAGR
ncbi:MAG: hypothetical protein ACE5HQ_03375 [Gemmatimonadota bacterium]